MKRSDKKVTTINVYGDNNKVFYFEGFSRPLAIILMAIPIFVVLLVILLRYPEFIPVFISKLWEYIG